jgi:hypothetical protein
MKQLFFFAVILLTALTHLQAQNDFTINADSVLITNDGLSAELIIENSTKNIRGLLVNKGDGHTEFRQVKKLNDSMFVFGADTFTVKGGGKGLQPVTDAGNTTTHFINADLGYYLKNILLLHSTDSILKVGFRAGQLNTSGNNTAVGYEALQQMVSSNGNTALGHQALQANIAYDNAAIGYSAMSNVKSGGNDVALGAKALGDDTSGTVNVGVGRQTSTSSGYNSVALGHFAHTSGTGGVAIGRMASADNSGYSTVVGNSARGGVSGNTVMGSGAFFGGGQTDNTAIGAYTLDYSNNGLNSYTRSTIVGARTGSGSYNMGVTTMGADNGGGGMNNTNVGYSSLYSRNYAVNNTTLGAYAGANIQEGSNNIALGYRADVPSTTDSFQLSIGNLIYGTRMDGTGNTVSNGKVGVKTKTPAYELDVNGKLGVRSMDSLAAAPNVLFHDPATGEIRKAALPKKQTFAQTATVTVSGTTAETTLIGAGAGSLTIPAASWFAGKSFRVVVRGVYSTSSSSPANLSFKIKLGSSVIAQTSEIFIGSGKSNVPFEVRGEIICRATGASGNVFSKGLVITDDELVVKLDNGNSGTAVDLSAAKTLDVTALFNNGAAGNSVSAFILTFEAIN